MNPTIRALTACFVVLCTGCASARSTQKRLTVRRIAELTAPTNAPHPKGYKVEISAIGSATLTAAQPEGKIEVIREFRFPVEFTPPRATASGAPPLTPTTPTAFETVNTGLTIHLSAKPHGKIIAIYGVADSVAFVGFDEGGYGAVAGPIYTEHGDLITPNKLQQPRFHSLSTRFHIFALPGEPYDVTLNYGGKAVKHKVTVTVK
jgi:hypothetical protein